MTAEPELGELVGAGASSTVHAWTPGRVVKLFRPGFEAQAAGEARRARALAAAGVPCPAVHELLEIDGRIGIVFDRVHGRSALGRRDGAAITARVHVDLHDVIAPEDLPRLVDTLAERGITGLPDGDRVYHGDFHPGNILHDGAGWSVIDWSDAHRAHPAADVACSILAIGYRGLRDGPTADDAHRRRARAADHYLDTYAALRPRVLDDLHRWTSAIGTLLLELEPDTAFADDLRRRWITPEVSGGPASTPADRRH